MRLVQESINYVDISVMRLLLLAPWQDIKKLSTNCALENKLLVIFYPQKMFACTTNKRKTNRQRNKQMVNGLLQIN